MALKKEIELNNGIILNYHRIVSINKITNYETIIEVASYTSKEKREIEKEALQNGEEFDVYIHATYFNKEYDEADTIENLYDYLKTTEMFKDAKDDFDSNTEEYTENSTEDSTEEDTKEETEEIEENA